MAYGSMRFGTRSAFRPSWLFVALVGLTIAGGLAAWFGTVNVQLAVIVFVLAGWMVSLCLHEYGHALLAYRGGDRHVAEAGYLTLNPLKYAHPILSIVLPVVFLLLGGIGLPGGAVWIDRHAIDSRRRQLWISLVGPLTNIVFGVLLAIPFFFLTAAGFLERPEFWGGVAFLGFLQITAGLLNLAPIPGVDGGNAYRPYLRTPWDRRFDLFQPYGMLILIVLLFEPRVNAIFFDVVRLLCELIGMPFDIAMYGRQLFQFWR